MKRFRRVVAVSAVIALLLFAAFLPAFAAMMENNHNCCGENCMVCRAISSIASGGIKLIALSELIGAIAALTGSLAFLTVAFSALRRFRTLVSLKKKLSN